ncbi:MAG: peptide ABC transporter substrate-binding protein [Chloroflexi bacterium]|nr:peptide ABC transporter substrate-binding protein [Chloroflexota bacterium]
MSRLSAPGRDRLVEGSISRRRLLGGSLALAAAFLAACRGGSESSDDVPAGATPAPAVAPTAPPPTPNVAATATVRAQLQSIRMPIAEPPTLDPALATDHSSVQVAIQLFEGLTETDEAGQPAPLGAERWEVGDEGRTYTFSLRTDRLWSDGSPVTAADYVWAWRRVIDPRTAADYAPLLYPIKNAARIHGERLDSALLGVTARDARTLVVNLEEPLAHFPRLTSLITFAPLKKEALERHGDRWIRPENIVTNGPFRLVEWQHDRQITLERNPTYPTADRLMPRATLPIFPDDGAAAVLSAYENSALDVFGTGASFELPPGDVERITADAATRPMLRTTAQSGTLFLAVNTRKPHLQDARVRRALGQVIEREKVLKSVLKRVGTPALTLTPDGIFGRDEGRWPIEDVAAARAGMADAGFPNGADFPPIAFAFNVSSQWTELGEYLRQRYKDTLGIELKLEPMEWTAYMRWRRSDEWAQNGDLQRGGWFSDYEDPYNWYNQIWDSREDPSSFNSAWAHDLYDAYVREAALTLDRAERLRLYQQADEILATEYPAIPIFYYGSRTLVRPYVVGFEPERLLSLVRLKRVRLDEAR